MTAKILTIGYGNQSVATVIDRLVNENIQYLIDVRSMPYSKYKPDFSRESLSIDLSRNNIKYLFMGDTLGGRPKDVGCYTQGKVDYEKVRSKDFFIRGMERLKKAYSQNLSICLFCSEGHPGHCHRSKLIAAALSDEGIEVNHITSDGSIMSQDEVIEDLVGDQPNLFFEHFTSRKSYR
jgi:uncharacterized protein (DUF488 family)